MRAPGRAMLPWTRVPRNSAPPRMAIRSALSARSSAWASSAPSIAKSPPMRAPRRAIGPPTWAARSSRSPRRSTRSAASPGSTDPSKDTVSTMAERKTGVASNRQSRRPMSWGIRHPSRSRMPLIQAPESRMPFSCIFGMPSPPRSSARIRSARTSRSASPASGSAPRRSKWPMPILSTKTASARLRGPKRRVRSGCRSASDTGGLRERPEPGPRTGCPCGSSSGCISRSGCGCGRR